MKDWSEDEVTEMETRTHETRLAEARHEVEEALKDSAPAPEFDDGLPLTDEAISTRTAVDRISLADDAPDVSLVPSYGGYLDLVVHGDESGTQADVMGQRVDLTLEQTARLIQESPSWDRRPVRLMSCSTGRASYAQELADSVGVVVYAPDDALSVDGGVNTILHDGHWRRFEPSEPASQPTHHETAAPQSVETVVAGANELGTRSEILRDVAGTAIFAAEVATMSISGYQGAADAARPMGVDLPGRSASIAQMVERQDSDNEQFVLEGSLRGPRVRDEVER